MKRARALCVQSLCTNLVMALPLLLANAAPSFAQERTQAPANAAGQPSGPAQTPGQTQPPPPVKVELPTEAPPASATQPAAPAAAQPTQGDFFSLTQIGQPLGQYLENQGIYLNLGYQQEFQADIAGGRKHGIAFTAEPYGGVDLDLQRILGIPNASFHVVFDDRIGRTVSFMAATNNALQDSYGPAQRLHLSELSYDQSLFDDHLRLLVGRINPTAEYLVSDFSCLFIAFTCAQPQSWYSNTAENPYPTSSWGLRLTVKPTPATYLRFGAYEEDPSLFLDNNAGFSWNTHNAVGVFIPAELGYETSLSTARYPSHYAIGGYTENSDYTIPPAAIGGASETVHGGRNAVWALLEQTVWRPDPSTARSLEVFAEFYMATGGYQEYPQSYVVGALMRGAFPSRPNDTLGIVAYNFNLNHRTAQTVNNQIALQGKSGTINPSQFTLQLNYGFRVAPGIFIRPDIEYNINPDQLNNTNPNPRIHNALERFPSGLNRM